MTDALMQGREAFARGAWGDAYAQLSAADRQSHADSADLERLAKAAHLTGRLDESEELLARAHCAYLDQGCAEEAARCGFWLGFQLSSQGEHARASGWLARAERILDDAGLESVVRGFLLLPAALGMLGGGDPAKAAEMFGRATEIGSRFEDTDLQTLGRLGHGQALVKRGKASDGMRLLDETMVSVTAGEVSPIIVGIVYCAVISACYEAFDLRRAQEWTAAFSRWCSSETDLVPFRGECLTRRAEIMQVHGDWSVALDEAQRAGELLTQDPGLPAAGAAFYRQAELHRLRGEFADAENAFREAAKWGRSPQPGLALMRLTQGRTDVAVSAIRRAIAESQDRRRRSALLTAAVDIYLASGDLPAARTAADELAGVAAEVDAPLLTALSSFAEGCILLEEGRHQASLGALNRAMALWRQVDAPYECARTRFQIACACRELGDVDGCEIELGEARRTFERLQARPDLDRLNAAFYGGAAPGAGHHERTAGGGAVSATGRRDTSNEGEAVPAGLTPREVEVLALVATGKTNRAIAEDLFISEKTVARHVSNIFAKLDVSSRAAATAYAYEHGLA